MKKKLYILKCFFLALFTSSGLLLEVNTKGLILNDEKFSYLILGLFFFWFYTKYLKIIKSHFSFRFLAFLFSFFLVVGYSYDKIETPNLLYARFELIIFTLTKFVGLFHMFNISINLLYEKIINIKIKDNKSVSKISLFFDKKPFIFCILILFISYIPYLIAYYPGIIANDPFNQIKEFMGEHTRYLDSIIPIDSNVTITNFNPVLHTLLVGSTFSIGFRLGNNSLGLFLYSIIQMTTMICILSFSICYMKKEGINRKLLYIALGVFALVPVFPFYAMTNNKDTFFTMFVLLYIIFLYDIIKNQATLKNCTLLFLTAMLVVLFRNNGIYTVFLSMPFLLIWVKNNKKLIVVSFALVILMNTFYNKIILPYFGISNTSIREALSIPFQQTARLVKYHSEIISEEDKEIIDQILIYDTLSDRYDSRISDPVKNRYNIYTTNEELKEYFKLWFKYLWKRPMTYINATTSNIYGYFYPNTSSWYIYYKYNTRLQDTDYHYSYNNLKPIRSALEGYGLAFPYIPVIGIFVNIGFSVWIYMFMLAVLIINKKRNYIPVLLPAFSLILVCIASPVNTYFRYAMPFIFTMPIVLLLLYNVLDKKKIH